MGALDDFKKFAIKGNVMDLAAGVIIGGAFGKVVSALVDRVLMPPLGWIIGGVHFAQLRFVLKAAGSDGKGEVAVGYGEFLESVVDFLAVALALYLIVKGWGAFRRWEAKAMEAAERAAAQASLLKAPLQRWISGESESANPPPALSPSSPNDLPAPTAPTGHDESVETLREIRDLLAENLRIRHPNVDRADAETGPRRC